MAKRKTPKVKDLKAEKISDEQLKRMQTLVSQINKVQFDIGQLEARKHEFVHMHLGITEEIRKLQEELKKEYGTTDVDIQSGKIKYNESHN
tara:strand:+ start:187 stop:459 length:273 start_codon:yes stop_codon:yes gene_type:complete